MSSSTMSTLVISNVSLSKSEFQLKEFNLQYLLFTPTNFKLLGIDGLMISPFSLHTFQARKKTIRQLISR